jgi:hypothetical protein
MEDGGPIQTNLGNYQLPMYQDGHGTNPWVNYMKDGWKFPMPDKNDLMPANATTALGAYLYGNAKDYIGSSRKKRNEYLNHQIEINKSRMSKLNAYKPPINKSTVAPPAQWDYTMEEKLDTGRENYNFTDTLDDNDFSNIDLGSEGIYDSVYDMSPKTGLSSNINDAPFNFEEEQNIDDGSFTKKVTPKSEETIPTEYKSQILQAFFINEDLDSLDFVSYDDRFKSSFKSAVLFLFGTPLTPLFNSLILLTLPDSRIQDYKGSSNQPFSIQTFR